MFKVSTLCFHAEIEGDRLLGHYFLPLCLTGAVYHDFLSEVFPELLEDVYLQSRINLWCLHDDDDDDDDDDEAPSHFLLAVQEFLNNVYPEQWVQQGKPTPWPAHS
jgi:hypothetical protein